MMQTALLDTVTGMSSAGLAMTPYRRGYHDAITSGYRRNPYPFGSIEWADYADGFAAASR